MVEQVIHRKVLVHRNMIKMSNVLCSIPVCFTFSHNEMKNYIIKTLLKEVEGSMAVDV